MEKQAPEQAEVVLAETLFVREQSCSSAPSERAQRQQQPVCFLQSLLRDHMSLLIEGGDILRSVEKRRDGATEENPREASRASTLLRGNAGCHICLYS